MKPSYSTHDLALASTLVTLGFQLTCIDKSEYSQRASFIFNQTNDLIETVQLYWAKQLQIEPRAYFEAMRLIKARLYEDKNEYN